MAEESAFYTPNGDSPRNNEDTVEAEVVGEGTGGERPPRVLFPGTSTNVEADSSEQNATPNKMPHHQHQSI